MRIAIVLGAALAACTTAPPETADSGPDAGARLDAAPAEPDAHPDTPQGPADARPDAEVLADCADVCAGEELSIWWIDGAPAYAICRPSYLHCAPPPACPASCLATCADGWCVCDGAACLPTP